MSGLPPGECELCGNTNDPGTIACEWCETPLPSPARGPTRPPRQMTVSLDEGTYPEGFPPWRSPSLSVPPAAGQPWPAPFAASSHRDIPAAPPVPRSRARNLRRPVVLVAAIMLLAAIGAYLNHDDSGSASFVSRTPVDFFDLAPGECVGALSYPSKLNSSPVATVDCADPLARTRFVAEVPQTETAHKCGDPTYQVSQYNSRTFCFERFLRVGQCYPVWVFPDKYRILLSLPHDCADDIRTGWDPDKAKPTEATRLSVQRVEKVEPKGTTIDCGDNLLYTAEFTNKTLFVCTRCAESGCPAA